MNVKKKLNPKLRVCPNETIMSFLAHTLEHNSDWKGYVTWTNEAERQINIVLGEWTKRGYVECVKKEDGSTKWLMKITPFVEDIPDEFDINIYRNLFSQQNIGHIGYMGTKKEVGDAMEDFLEANPDYTYDDVLEATKSFIKHKKKKGEQQFIPKAVNFIRKIDPFTGELIKSDLLTILENPIEKDKTNTGLL